MNWNQFSACITVAISPVFVVASLAVMSIDLGNEFMKIGIVKPGVPMEIVLNMWVNTALAVFFQISSSCGHH